MYINRTFPALNVTYSRPDYYEVSHLPAKLPPPKQPVSVTSLPMLGYLEQSVATSIINALTAVGAQKPKYPFLSSTKSALIYVAYHLKGEEITINIRVCIESGWLP